VPLQHEATLAPECGSNGTTYFSREADVVDAVEPQADRGFGLLGLRLDRREIGG
jgi:hypothetical protein